MTYLRLHLRSWASLLALAMLCIALAPGLTKWVRASQGIDDWAAICSAPVKLFAQGAESPKDGSLPVSQLMGDHCPWCAHGVGWPPMAVQQAVALGHTTTLPERFYSAPRPLFAWASAQPRAPPVRLA